MRDLVLRQDSATGMFTFETDAYHPADGIKVAALDANGHSTYYTTAMQARQIGCLLSSRATSCSELYCCSG